MRRRVLSWVTAIMLVFGMIAVDLSMNAERVEAATLTIADLRAKFPDGKYWNHVAGHGHRYRTVNNIAVEDLGPCNNPDGYTDSPCATHDGIASIGQTDCNSWDNAIQCVGFALKCASDVYGESARNWSENYSTAGIKAGDILSYVDDETYDKTNGHTVFVIGVNGNFISVVECNNGPNCRITWDRSINLAGIQKIIVHRVAPYEAPMGSNAAIDIDGAGLTVPEGDYQILSASGEEMTLDAPGDSATVAEPCDAQIWKGYYRPYDFFSLEYLNNGFYKIVHKASGKVLDVYGLSQDNAGRVFYADYNGGNNQQWSIEPYGDGWFGIRARHSGLYLDVYGAATANGSKVVQHTGNGSIAQRWRFLGYHGETRGFVDTCEYRDNGEIYIDGWGYDKTRDADWATMRAYVDGAYSAEFAASAPYDNNDGVQREVGSNNHKYYRGLSVNGLSAGLHTVKVVIVDSATGTEVISQSAEGVSLTVNVPGPTISNIRITDQTTNGFTVTCDVSDPAGIQMVQFPTWTEVNGQDDLQNPYPSGALSNPGGTSTSASFQVLYADHNSETGKYYTDIYAFNSYGIYEKYATVTFEPPVVKPTPDEDLITDIVLAVNQKTDLNEHINKSYKKYTVTPKGYATIDQKGILTAKKEGPLKVTGLVKNGKKWEEGESVTFTVIKPSFLVKSLESTYLGQTISADTYLRSEGITPTSYVSSKTNVAEVNDEGTITAKGIGTTKITVAYGRDKNAARYSITLKVAIPKLNKKNLKLQTGATAQLKLTNTKAHPIWSTGDDNKITVTETGKITALLAGNDTVTATLDGQEYICQVEIDPPAIVKPAASVKIGKTFVVKLKNTKLKNIEWRSSDLTVATVDAKGKVKGISAGTADIITTAGGVTNICTVTVVGKVDSKSITVSTSDELLKALGSNKTIVLNDGVYVFEDSLLLGKYKNLVLCAKNPGRAEIMCTCLNAPVIWIWDSSNVSISGLILGHSLNGYNYEGCGPDGYVVDICECSDIKIDSCDMFGCGVIGVYLYRSSKCVVSNSVIRDCEYLAVSSDNSDSSFQNCIITANGFKSSGGESSEKATIAAWTWSPSTITVDSCQFFNGGNELLTSIDGEVSKFVVNNCVFRNNVFDGETPGNYGICLNGLTWQVQDSVLKIGYPIVLDDGYTIQNKANTVLPYSSASKPWRKEYYTSYDIADGIQYQPELFSW